MAKIQMATGGIDWSEPQTVELSEASALLPMSPEALIRWGEQNFIRLLNSRGEPGDGMPGPKHYRMFLHEVNLILKVLEWAWSSHGRKIEAMRRAQRGHRADRRVTSETGPGKHPVQDSRAEPAGNPTGVSPASRAPEFANPTEVQQACLCETVKLLLKLLKMGLAEGS